MSIRTQMKPHPFVAQASLRTWPAAAVLTLLLIGCEKAQLDDEARGLCAQDGGITVYESVKRQVSNVDPNAGLALPPLGKQSAGDQFAYAWTSRTLKSGNPSLNREEIRIIRLSDGKALGQLVSYSRIGGDMPGPWHESHFSCPEGADTRTLMRAVFVD